MSKCYIFKFFLVTATPLNLLYRFHKPCLRWHILHDLYLTFPLKHPKHWYLTLLLLPLLTFLLPLKRSKVFKIPFVLKNFSASSSEEATLTISTKFIFTPPVLYYSMVKYIMPVFVVVKQGFTPKE